MVDTLQGIDHPKQRTMLGYRLGCTFNSLEEEKPQNKADKDELETLEGQDSVRETRGKMTVQEGEWFQCTRLQRGKTESD